MRAIFLKAPPTRSKLNQMPLSQAVRFVSSAPHIPPTCFDDRSVPKRRPREIKKMALGILAITQYRIPMVGLRPKKRENRSVKKVWRIAITNKGRV